MKFVMSILAFLLTGNAMGSPVLIGGKIAKDGEFPEVIYITSGRSRCSAAVVGPKVVLTAAHCISDQGDIEPVAEFVYAQQAFKARCTHHPEYASQYSYDFALCKTKEVIDVKYATISKKSVELGAKASLMGYGCVNPRDDSGNGGNGGNDGKLRWNLAEIVKLPSDNGVGGGQYFYTNDNTALCFGDSGGPAMMAIENPLTDAHLVVGTNSRGDIRRRSLLSSTFLPGFQDWAKAYAIANQVDICGINAECMGPKPKPKPKCRYAKFWMDHHAKGLEKWTKRFEQCEAGQ